MADQPTPPSDDRPAETEWQRRRRLAAVFGDVLPETTSDERDPEPNDDESSGDAWLRAQVPPHHG
jgi:hypothetical protein